MKKTFGFKGVEEVKGRIEPSIEKAQIIGVSDDTNDNDKYFLAVNLLSLDGNREHTERFYFSTPKGEKISLQRVKSLLKEILGDKKSEGEYTVEELNAMLTGQKGRFKFIGEEYEYNGDLRLRTQLAYSGFCENLSISDEDSRLKFNAAKDIKRLPMAPSRKADGNGVSDELF